MKLETKKNYGMPDQLAPDTEKIKPEYGLKVADVNSANAITGTSNNRTSMAIVFIVDLLLWVKWSLFR